MTRRRLSRLGPALVTLVLAGCASGQGAGPGEEAPPSAPSSPDPTEPTVTLSPEPRPTRSPAPPVGTTAADAVADLAARLGVDPQQVTVVRDEAVTWRDGSLGCPVPGMAYTQALTPGRLVVLEAAGRTAEYHSGGQRGLFLCEDPEPPLETEPDR